MYEVSWLWDTFKLRFKKFWCRYNICPTCGRTKVDLVEVVNKIESITKDIKKPLKIAIMGCIVNGPGEARRADIGIAYGIKKAAIFVKGKVIARVNAKEAVDYFKKELDNLFK